MKLWLLESPRAMYDELQACVVRAETEHEARELACTADRSTHAREDDDPPSRPAFMNRETVTCVELTTEGEAGVVCADFYEP